MARWPNLKTVFGWIIKLSGESASLEIRFRPAPPDLKCESLLSLSVVGRAAASRRSPNGAGGSSVCVYFLSSAGV